MSRRNRIDARRDTAMPLEKLPDWKRHRIEELVASPKPPPRLLNLYAEDSPFPVAAIVSRAWFEWHWARGIDPEGKRERIPDHVGGAVIERDWPFCQICGGQIALGEHHLDHIIPWSLGGEDTVNNLRLTHDICNMQRGARTDGT